MKIKTIHNIETIRIRPVTKRDLSLVMAALICLISLFAIIWLIIQFKSDWGMAYRPAVWRWINGESPYEQNNASWPFANAPWILPVLLPLAILPSEWGRVALFFINLVCYLYLLKTLKAGKVATIAFLLSPPVITGLICGQIEGLLSLGYIVPPVFGLFFIVAKPQIGIGLVIYWMVESWRKGGWKRIVLTFAPVGLAVLISAILFPDWLIAMGSLPLVAGWNRSIWPQGLPIGVVLLVIALRSRRKELAISSSVFFAPYLSGQTWATGLIGLVGDGTLMTLAVVAMWVVFILR